MTRRVTQVDDLDRGLPDVWARTQWDVILPTGTDGVWVFDAYTALQHHARAELAKPDLPEHQRVHWRSTLTAIRREIEHVTK